MTRVFRVVTYAAVVILTILAGYLIGGSLGWWDLLSAWSKADPSVVMTAGATVALAAFGVLAWTASFALVEQGEKDRANQRAHLRVVFDQSKPELWWKEKQWIRVMVENTGPAMARNVIASLERIEPQAESPMLESPTLGGIKGVNVLPSPLSWKGRREEEDARWS